jgi:formylglycine-generating enzyme required for sulfatase activity
MKIASVVLLVLSAALTPLAIAQNPAGSDPTGTQLVILSNVPGTVRIDGVDRGEVQADIPLRLPAQPGEHIVEVFAGEQRYQKAIAVQRGASQVVQVNFQSYDWQDWPETLTDDLGIEFLLIKPGTFKMGSAHLGTDEKPVHEVTMNEPFYLSKTEVTQAQWQAVMSSNPSSFYGATNPVESVSWNDVQRFLKTLNESDGCAGCYRLPTEAEWEFAARAGTSTPYNYGEDVNELHIYAWYASNAEGKTHPVGQKRPNAWGLYDMHGNVWEWVEDRHAPYPGGAANETASAGDTARVLRGGGWSSYATNLRSANRNHDTPVYRSNNVGFRLVRPLP